MYFFQHYTEIHPSIKRHEYKCSRCHYHHPSFFQVDHHFQYTHKKPGIFHPLKCDDCVQPYFLEEALAYHKKLEHDEEIIPFNCDECQREFFTQSGIMVHETLHVGETKQGTLLTCSYCTMATYSPVDLNQHHKENHPILPLPNFICEEEDCDYLSESQARVETHMKNKHGLDEFLPYKCTQCDFVTKDFNELKRHMYNSGHRETFDCKACSKKFYAKSNLHTHTKKEHISMKNPKVFPCSHCSKRFNSNQRLEFHLDGIHPGIQENKFSCEKCGKMFMFNSSYRKHMHQHTWKEKIKARENDPDAPPKQRKERKVLAPSDAYVKCQYCDMDLHKWHLLRHCRREHPDKVKSPAPKRKLFYCSQCALSYSTEIFLVRHEYVAHGILRHPNVCKKCQAPYQTTHKHCLADKKQGEMKTCEYCGKIFTRSVNLRDHIRAAHENKKTVKCDECGKSFASRKRVQDHILQSHSKKTCPHCHKSIHNAFFLKRHLVFDHGMTEGAFFCSLCPKKVFFKQTMLEKHLNSHKDGNST